MISNRVAVWDTAGAIGPILAWWMLTSIAIAAATAAAIKVVGREGHYRRTAILGYLGIGTALAAASLALTGGSWALVTVPAFAFAVALMLTGGYAIGPLEFEVQATAVQRDLVVAGAEAERHRIVSDIHDGPLAGLTLLVQRLDDTGDAQGAALARSVASDLRSLGNELRAPILEDLGAGPAIEWLAERITERTQVPIEATLDDSAGRPPSAVEVAVFRVAQEALINAVRHGGGPVQVFYLAEPGQAQLTVLDSGSGIEPGAEAAATRDGHLGLTLMRRRAAAIGARLEIARTEPHGTCVELQWRGSA